MQTTNLEVTAPKIPCFVAIERGLCKAECCGPVPFSSAQYYQTKHLACVEPIAEARSDDRQYVVPIADDLHCVFLNRADFRCSIYEQRPGLCRQYGLIDELQCPCFTPAGYLRTRAERKRMKRDIEKRLKAATQGYLKAIRRKV